MATEPCIDPHMVSPTPPERHAARVVAETARWLVANLIPDLTRKAEASGIARIGNLRPTHGWYSAGRYLEMGPGRFESWMGIDYACWSR